MPRVKLSTKLALLALLGLVTALNRQWEYFLICAIIMTLSLVGIYFSKKQAEKEDSSSSKGQ